MCQPQLQVTLHGLQNLLDTWETVVMLGAITSAQGTGDAETWISAFMQSDAKKLVTKLETEFPSLFISSLQQNS